MKERKKLLSSNLHKIYFNPKTFSTVSFRKIVTFDFAIFHKFENVAFVSFESLMLQVSKRMLNS